MNGALPPSSKLTRFSVPAASFASILPTLVEPVKLILRTRGFVANSVAAARSLVGQTWSVFDGSPAWIASFVRARQVNGVSDGGLITTVQPAASAGAILRVIMAAGKFHGVMIAQVPTGSVIVYNVVWEVEDGMDVP